MTLTYLINIYNKMGTSSKFGKAVLQDKSSNYRQHRIEHLLAHGVFLHTISLETLLDLKNILEKFGKYTGF